MGQTASSESVKEYWNFRNLVVKWEEDPTSVTLEEFQKAGRKASFGAKNNQAIIDFFKQPDHFLTKGRLRQLVSKSLTQDEYQELLNEQEKENDETKKKELDEIILDYQAVVLQGNPERLAEIQGDTSQIEMHRMQIDSQRLEIAFALELCKHVEACVKDKESIGEMVGYFRAPERANKRPFIEQAVKSQTVDSPEAPVQQDLVDLWLRDAIY